MENAFKHAGRKLLVLGFSGTLMPRNQYFHPGILSTCRVPDSTRNNLRMLSDDPSVDIVIMSSVSQEALDHALGEVPNLWLVAESGVTWRSAARGAECAPVTSSGGGGAAGELASASATDEKPASAAGVPSTPRSALSITAGGLVVSGEQQQAAAVRSEEAIEHRNSNSKINGPASANSSSTGELLAAAAVGSATPVGATSSTSVEDDQQSTTTVSTSKQMTAGSASSGSAGGGVGVANPQTMVNPWHSLIDEINTEWLQPVEEIIEYFADRTPGSFIHKTSTTISWSLAPGSALDKNGVNHGTIQSKDLLIHLWAGPLLSTPAEVLVGANSVEVRCAEVSRGTTYQRLYSESIFPSGTSLTFTPPGGSGTTISASKNLLAVAAEATTSVRSPVADGGPAAKTSTRNKATSAAAVVASDDKAPATALEHSTFSTPRPAAALSPFWGVNLSTAAAVGANASPSSETTQGNANAAQELAPSNTSPKDSHAARGDTSASSSLMQLGLTSAAHDFVLVAGDFLNRDEDLFQIVRECGGPQEIPHFYACTVGEKPSRAMYHMAGSDDVAFLLAKFAYHTSRAMANVVTESGN
ncbi:unnamed protein product [Amoebophrya sp. A25]|nr:unnamed protein product [Amoebophrya sp. A25]|eukprot:GSA25T00006159001.1